MSTPSGDEAIVASFVAEAKALLTEAQAEEARQDDLFQPTPEEMLEARDQLGPEAGRLSVVNHAREARRRGRPPGARNKSTSEFKKYILGFGQHPAITMMQIQATPPEILMANSRRKVTKIVNAGKDQPDKIVEIEEETLTYEGAQAMRIRCAEGVLPYIEGKQPIAIDMNFSGVADMMIEGLTHTREEMDEARRMKEAIEGEFYDVDDADPEMGK